MISWLIFWSAVAVFSVVHGLLIRSAARFRNDNSQPANLPALAGQRGLFWTFVPALATTVFLVVIYRAMAAGAGLPF